MSEKKRFVQSKYAHHLQDIKTDTHYYLTSEKIGCKDLFDEIERLTEENEQLKETNKKLQQELDKTREDLNYFANLKVGAMKVDGYGHDRCYVTSMQKKR